MHRAKEYLGQIRRLENQIAWLDREIERNRYLLMPGGIRYDTDRVQTSPEDKMSRIASEVADLLTRQEDARARLAKVRDRIIVQVSAIPDESLSRLLYLRYVDGLSLYAIARKMHYSQAWAKKNHGKALDSFAKMHLD